MIRVLHRMLDGRYQCLSGSRYEILEYEEITERDEEVVWHRGWNRDEKAVTSLNPKE